VDFAKKVGRWIVEIAMIKKFDLKVIKVNLTYFSTTCPKCRTLIKNDYRTSRYKKCDFEEHRDYVSVLNLYGRGILHLSTAHGVKGGKTTQTVRTPVSGEKSVATVVR